MSTEPAAGGIPESSPVALIPSITCLRQTSDNHHSRRVEALGGGRGIAAGSRCRGSESRGVPDHGCENIVARTRGFPQSELPVDNLDIPVQSAQETVSRLPTYPRQYVNKLMLQDLMNTKPCSSHHLKKSGLAWEGNGRFCAAALSSSMAAWSAGRFEPLLSDSLYAEVWT